MLMRKCKKKIQIKNEIHFFLLVFLPIFRFNKLYVVAVYYCMEEAIL